MARRSPQITDVTPAEGRSKLATDFGRVAFDKINRMAPAWRLMETTKANGAPAVSLAPSLSIFHPDGIHKKSFQFGVAAATLDESVVKVHESLVQHMGDGFVVATGADGKESAYSYDAAIQYFKPEPGFRPGCCGICGNCKWSPPSA